MFPLEKRYSTIVGRNGERTLRANASVHQFVQQHHDASGYSALFVKGQFLCLYDDMTPQWALHASGLSP